MQSMFRAALAAVMLLVAGGVANAQDKQVTFGFPNFYFNYKEGNDAKGWAADVFGGIMKTAGYTVKYEELPPARLKDYLADGTVDFAFLVKSLPAEGTTKISAEPVAHMVLEAYGVGKDPGVTKKEDLVGKRVVVKRGYSYVGVRKFIDDNKIEIVAEVNSAAQGLAVTKERGADLFLDFRGNMTGILAGSTPVSGIQPADIKPSTMIRAPLHIIVSNKSKHAEALYNTLTTEHAKMKAAGKFDADGHPMEGKSGS